MRITVALLTESGILTGLYTPMATRDNLKFSPVISVTPLGVWINAVVPFVALVVDPCDAEVCLIMHLFGCLKTTSRMPAVLRLSTVPFITIALDALVSLAA